MIRQGNRSMQYSMANRLYVGNLPYETTDQDLSQLFGQYGEVVESKMVTDRQTGRSKGFAFIEMKDDAQAQAAIDGLNNTAMGGRTIVVNEARPMEARAPRSGGMGGGGGGGGSRGGFGRRDY